MNKKREYTELFKPVRIGNVEIKNRIAMTPMCTSYQNPINGSVTEQLKAFYAARALGGTGLLIPGTVTVTKLHADRRGPSGMKMLDHSAKPGLAELAETAHMFGAKIFIQISTGQGRQVYSKRQWVDPSLDVISADDRVMTPNPLFHANAQVYSTMGSLAAGASLVLLKRFSSSQILEQTRHYQEPKWCSCRP